MALRPNSDNVGGSSPHRQQESFHPNSWGELALRSCLRQACNNGSIRGGAFVIDQTGLKTATSPGCA